MNETQLNHPNDDTLRALSMGQLTEIALADVSAHLGNCPACCSRIDQLATIDPLIARLRQNAASREKLMVSPAQRRSAVRAIRQSKDPRSALWKFDGRERRVERNAAPLSAAPIQIGD